MKRVPWVGQWGNIGAIYGKALALSNSALVFAKVLSFFLLPSLSGTGEKYLFTCCKRMTAIIICHESATQETTENNPLMLLPSYLTTFHVCQTDFISLLGYPQVDSKLCEGRNCLLGASTFLILIENTGLFHRFLQEKARKELSF